MMAEGLQAQMIKPIIGELINGCSLPRPLSLYYASFSVFIC